MRILAVVCLLCCTVKSLRIVKQVGITKRRKIPISFRIYSSSQPVGDSKDNNVSKLSLSTTSIGTNSIIGNQTPVASSPASTPSITPAPEDYIRAFTDTNLANEGTSALQINELSANERASSKSANYKSTLGYLTPIILLILQNSGLILFMRYSIVNCGGKKRYIISTAVLCSELIKFTMSALLSLWHDVNGSLYKFKDLLYEECITKHDEFVRIIVPSILYAIQNNLQYVAVANLSAPVFQTMYQMKIVTTALFSVMLLKRKLLIHQWMSILTLFMGASAVQLSQQQSHVVSGSSNMVGLITVVVSCFTSGFSGVYFEKTLKNKKAKASIWLRNVQMSFFGILIGALGCLTNDKGKIAELGFFYGYNSIVWTVILLQALGGLVVSMVVKHADNLMKGFATSISIVISCGLSSLFFHDLQLNKVFMLGSAAVVASTIAFGYTPKVSPNESIALAVEEEEQ